MDLKFLIIILFLISILLFLFENKTTNKKNTDNTIKKNTDNTIKKKVSFADHINKPLETIIKNYH